MRTWVLVAEASRARIFEMETRTSPLVEVGAFGHPEGHVPIGEQLTDGPGRFGTIKSGRSVSITGGAHTFRREDPERPLQENFARTLAEELERGRIEKRYDQLVLVAAPAFLGLIRAELSPSVERMIVEEVPKNISRETPEAIRARIRTALEPVETADPFAPVP